MKNSKYFFLLFLLFSFSCVKDHTVSDFKTLNEITIDDMGKSHEIEIGGRLRITPTIKTKLNDESSLQYVWYKYNNSQTVADTISYEKNLDVEIFDVLPGVPTTVMLKVIDGKTGIYTRKGTTLITKGIYSDGTLMICRNGNDYDLGFLRSKTDALLENVYSYMNEGEKLGEKSKRILFTDPDVRQPVIFKAVIVTCDDNTGGVYLDPNALQRKAYMKDKFVLPNFSGDIIITGCVSDQSNDYLFINGFLYPRPNASSGGGDGQWFPELTLLTESTEYKLSDGGTSHPLGYPLGGNPLVYDNLNSRFMMNLNGGYFSFLKNVTTGGKFDPDDLGEGVEMVLSGSSNASNEDNWALMKDTKKDEYFVITYMFVYNEENWTYEFMTKSRTPLPRSNYPNLYNGTLMTSGTVTQVTNMYPWEANVRGISDIFFFLNQNKIYAFNIGNLSEVQIIDGSTLSNSTITAIDCQYIPEPTEADPKANYVRLGLAVRDNTLSTKAAGLVFYRLNNIGGLSATKYYTRSGICDEIIYFKEKLD